MWCLLSLVCCFLKPFYTPNEAILPHFRCAHSCPSEFCALRSVDCRSYGTNHGQRAADFLLSCFVRVDGLSVFLSEFRCVYSIFSQKRPVERPDRKLGSHRHCNWNLPRRLRREAVASRN